MKEKYQPSSEETQKAEEMMTDEEKKLSEAREEGYQIAKSSEFARKTEDGHIIDLTYDHVYTDEFDSHGKWADYDTIRGKIDGHEISITHRIYVSDVLDDPNFHEKLESYSGRIDGKELPEGNEDLVKNLFKKYEGHAKSSQKEKDERNREREEVRKVSEKRFIEELSKSRSLS